MRPNQSVKSNKKAANKEVPHDATLAAQVATATYVWASVPTTPVPVVNVAAFQATVGHDPGSRDARSRTAC